MTSRVLVVGANGFIGTQLVNTIARSRPVVAVSRQPVSSFSSAVVRVPQAIDSVHQYNELLATCDDVVWLACVSTPGSSAGEPIAELSENLRPLLILLTALQAHPDCRLLYVSTGGALYGDVAGGSASEDLCLLPKSYYGAGKGAAEHFIQACCQQFGCRATVLRPSNVYGHGQPVRPGFGVVPTAFAALAHDREFTIWGDGETVRDYLNIDDFVALCEIVLDRPVPEGVRTFNASTAVGVSTNQMLTAIETVTDRKLRRKHLPARALDVSRIVLDNRRIVEAFAWSPRVSLHAGLSKAWLSFQNSSQ